MDSPIRIKTAVGEHNFDLEGPPDYVREQYQAWQELVRLALASKQVQQQSDSDPAGAAASPHVKPKTDQATEPDLSKIMRVDGRYVSLTARVPSVHDAVLLMLYGQKALRNNDAVTGAELIGGLNTTGGFGDPRLDRIMEKIAIDGDVTSWGERRGKKYRMTNTGIGKARELAKELVNALA
jgi:hypothetical protein